MANTTTIIGNLTREPEIRYTREGQATAQLGVAVNRRWQDRTTQEWQEATSFFDVICWRDLAENVALSLTKGMRVVVTGRLEQRTWETEDGDHRSKVEITADEVGPSLRFATADVHKVERRGRGLTEGRCRRGADAVPVGGVSVALAHHDGRPGRGSGCGDPRLGRCTTTRPAAVTAVVPSLVLVAGPGCRRMPSCWRLRATDAPAASQPSIDFLKDEVADICGALALGGSLLRRLGLGRRGAAAWSLLFGAVAARLAGTVSPRRAPPRCPARRSGTAS